MGGNVDTIKERLDIVDVIRSYLKLEKSGVNFKARCPFHNEKTASFYVSPARQSFYCFGCGMKGDMFTFIQETEGIDFRGALKILADRAGVELEFQRGESKTEKDKLYAVLEDATKFFQMELERNNTAKVYLLSRGLSEESISYWKLGYAPAEWRSLYSHLVSLAHSEETIIKAGLAKKVEGESKPPYDVFRDRLIFPLSDSGGRVIGFSGRALGEEAMPKYLNSPDTPLFIKSEVLYGLDKAKEEIRKKDYTVLVEGQMDMVMSHQAGVKNAVASSGTAFTAGHLERLKRLSDRIILAFDGDKAGLAAAYKSTVLGLSLGMEVKVAPVPSGSDPAELVKNNPDQWREALRKSLHAIDHEIDRVFLEEADGRKRAKLVEKRVLPLIMLLQSSMERSHFVAQVSKKMGIKEEVVWEDLRKVKSPELHEVSHHPSEKSEGHKILPRKSYIERKLVGIIWWQEELALKGAPNVDVASLRGEVSQRVGGEYFKELVKSLEIDKESLVFEAESYYSDPKKLPEDIVELLDNLTDDLLRAELGQLIATLARLETMKDDEGIARLTSQIHEVHARMRSLEEKRKVS